MKLCLIYNFAQHYRSSIFRLIDQEYDCDYFFGDAYLNVKKMDYSLLKGNVTEVTTKKLFGGWLYRPRIQALAEGIARWFEKHKNDREEVRQACMKEIDENWTPQFQLNVLREHLK